MEMGVAVILVILVVLLLETTFILITSNLKDLRALSREKVLLDTSVLMDGRILSIARTHFLGYDIVIPRSVLLELQLLADGKDNDRRNRARYGLDIAGDLQKVGGLRVKIYEDDLKRGEYVDEKLIALAKKTRAHICTTDFNLNKVADADGITVLNINELAIVMKNQYMPGERVRVKITGTGNNQSQGVGHLQDGTMVIVENGNTHVGSELDVDVLRFLQTSAGRMIFAKIPSNQTTKKKHKKKA
ncbi:TRAM domain-containing protein [Candidatus Saccharibacteria bacterium]|nr:TRAM domain-containing protein [Candidatus Saccharibacteria bacterium]